jgi:hypothetical protein
MTADWVQRCRPFFTIFGPAFCRRVRSLLDRQRPGTQFILDTLGVSSACYVNGHDLARHATPIDRCFSTSGAAGASDLVIPLARVCRR